ncbi:MAG: hypothetical protein EBX37_06555 [Alphaproteobacteria bacterium]|nr:hypothetical protein [Alphaproteobacteria bacterium]
MNATSHALPRALRISPRRADRRPGRPWPGQPSDTTEENPWMQHEDLAPAWAVSGLTLAAMAALFALAMLG